MLALLIRIVKWLIVLILPFIALIRGAIYVHSNYSLGPWVSLGGGVFLTIIILFIYMTVVHGMFSSTLGSVRAFKRRFYIAALMLFGYCIHALFFISSNNIKNSALQQELRQLHPIVRVAVSTIIMVDKSLVITDASRSRSDYRDMGLPVNERSLHFPQKDGYAYAIDLRTRDRSTLRNILLQSYFRLMGFKTLHHGGTGPHLHISLKVR